MTLKSDGLAPMERDLKPPRSPKGHPQGLPGRGRSNGQGQVRKPGVEWNNSDEIDDGRDEALDVSEDEKERVRNDEPIENSPSGGQVVDLLDIARPAKSKGIAREFEVVQGSPRVIALPDEPRVPAIMDEDWENIDSEGSEDMDQRKSYSAVVRDNAED